MWRSLPLTALLALLLPGACSPSRSESGKGEPAASKAPAKATSHTAVVADADGKHIATLVRAPGAATTCAFTTTGQHTIARSNSGALTLAGPGGEALGSIEGTGNVLLKDGAGKTIGRVVHPPNLNAMSLIDSMGVAVFRIRVDKQGRAVIRDKASMPVLIVHNRGGRFVAENKAGAVRAYVTGEDDPMVAALLTAEFVEPQLRGLLACDWALGKTKKYVP